MKSKMTLFANTGGKVHSAMIHNHLRKQWFQSNAGSSYTCTLPNKTDTPRTSMQNFNGLQQFRNHFLLFSGRTPCWLQINLRLRILSWKPLTHHFEQISWNGIRNANELELTFILSLLKICGDHRQLPNFDKVRSRTLRVPHVCKHGGDVVEDITLIGLISASDSLNAMGANPTSANKHAAIQNF